MARRRTQARPPSYFWALHLEVSDRGTTWLKDGARRGLDWATELAKNHYNRQRSFPHHEDWPRLTIEDIAYREDLPVFTVRMAIAQARRQLFGRISDSGIRDRIRRHKAERHRLFMTGEPPPLSGRCAEPGCTRSARGKYKSKRGPRPRYCAKHSTSAARVARHRALKTKAS